MTLQVDGRRIQDLGGKLHQLQQSLGIRPFRQVGADGLAQDIVGRGGGEALDAAPGLYQDMPEGGGRVEAEAVMVGGSVKIWVGKQVFQQGHGGLAIDGASAVGKDGAGAKRAAWRQGDHITPEGNFPRLQKQAAAGCLQRGAAVKI